MRIWHLALLHLLIGVQSEMIRVPLYVTKSPAPSHSKSKHMLVSYYGSVGVGQHMPYATLNLKFSTDTSLFWALSEKSNWKYLRDHRRILCSQSFACQKNPKMITVNYLKGNLTGFVFSHTVSIGGSKIQNQTIIEVMKLSDPDFLHDKYDGICGLGIRNWNKKAPFLMNMINQKLIKDAVFSIYLKKKPKKLTSKAGEIIFGGSDSKCFKREMHYVSVSGPGDWQVQLNRVQDGEVLYCSENCSAVITSGYSFIGVPKDSFAKLIKAIGAKKKPNSGYEVQCNRIPYLKHIHFYFNNKAFTLTGQDYIRRETRTRMLVCLLDFEETDRTGDGLWILGDVFLRKFYVEFNLQDKKIGVAESI